MVCGMLHSLAWIHNSDALLRHYIPYYNRAVALVCPASGVAVVSGMGCRASGRVYALRRDTGGVIFACIGLASSAVEWGKSQERHCKTLCSVLRRWRYNCMNETKRAINACMGLYCSGTKQKPCTLSRYKAKEKPRQRGRGGNVLVMRYNRGAARHTVQ